MKFKYILFNIILIAFCLLLLVSCNDDDYTMKIGITECGFVEKLDKYICEEYYTNCFLAKEYEYKFHSNRNVLDGKFEEYYPNGNRKRIAYYDLGTQIHNEKTFYKNGSIWEHKFYFEGRLQGNHYKFSPNKKIERYIWYCASGNCYSIDKKYGNNQEIDFEIPYPIMIANKDMFDIGDTIVFIIHFPVIPHTDTNRYYWEEKENDWVETTDTFFIYKRITNEPGKYTFKAKIKVNNEKHTDLLDSIKNKVSEFDFQVLPGKK